MHLEQGDASLDDNLLSLTDSDLRLPESLVGGGLHSFDEDARAHQGSHLAPQLQSPGVLLSILLAHLLQSVEQVFLLLYSLLLLSDAETLQVFQALGFDPLLPLVALSKPSKQLLTHSDLSLDLLLFLLLLLLSLLLLLLLRFLLLRSCELTIFCELQLGLNGEVLGHHHVRV